MNCIIDYSSYVYVEKGTAGLVTGLEVEYLSRTTVKARARAEYISTLIPAVKEEFVRLRNIEGLAVKLLAFKCKVLWDPLCDGVSRKHIPDHLLTVTSPTEISVSSDYCAKGL